LATLAKAVTQALDEAYEPDTFGLEDHGGEGACAHRTFAHSLASNL